MSFRLMDQHLFFRDRGFNIGTKIGNLTLSQPAQKHVERSCSYNSNFFPGHLAFHKVSGNQNFLVKQLWYGFNIGMAHWKHRNDKKQSLAEGENSGWFQPANRLNKNTCEGRLLQKSQSYRFCARPSVSNWIHTRNEYKWAMEKNLVVWGI